MYTYEDIIGKLNKEKIDGFRFYIKDYAHYNDCKILRKKHLLPNGKVISSIRVLLTKDSSEMVSFYRTFNDDYKLFKMGCKGTFTLKQLWHRVVITEVLKEENG